MRASAVPNGVVADLLCLVTNSFKKLVQKGAVIGLGNCGIVERRWPRRIS